MRPRTTFPSQPVPPPAAPATPSYHDSNPIHHIGPDGAGLKREGDKILVYPGPVILTMSEWASAVAFTTFEGDNGIAYRAVLALLGESQ